MRLLILLIRRLLVFGLGVFTVYLIAFVFFDFADKRLPWIFALAVTYGLAAYVILPRALRIGLKILKRGHVPTYTITADGLPGDPINLALVGALPQLRAAFAAAGWSEADRLSLSSSWRMVRAFLLKSPYPTAPFSTLYLFGRGQDIGFQKPIGDSPRQRHHVRFWAMNILRAEATLDSADFWLNADRPAENEEALWLGAATKDTGISLTRLTFQITHATASDTNLERDFIFAELQRRQLIIGDIRSHLPGERVNVGKVNHYVTDGEVSVATLSA
jgi:hypothetical protein